MFSNEMGDAMGEGTRLSTPSTSHHQQRPLVVIHRPALGVVEAGQKAHDQNVRAKKQEAIRTRGLCVGLRCKHQAKMSGKNTQPTSK
jgi:hypothetical protein